MKIYHDIQSHISIKNAVVTTGSFDGVHLGHKMILNRLISSAHEHTGESVLITFHPHPRKVLFPDTSGKTLRLINSQKEKITLLSKTGLQNLIIIPFSLAFSEISSVDFIRTILVGKLKVRKVITGFNHHFGHNREGNFEYLFELGRYYGFEVEEIPRQEVDKETVSSTKIREALLAGRIQRANAYLDNFYLIIGNLTLSPGWITHQSFQIYRLQITEDVKLIPPEGVYAVSVSASEKQFKGMLNIKHTVLSEIPVATQALIEMHLFDCDCALNGKEVSVYFHKRMRDELNFKSENELLSQIMIDKAEIEQLIF